MAKYSKGAKAVKEFIDPPSTKLQDWQWRPLEAVSKDLSLTEIPDYIQKGYGSFMAEQAKRAAAGDLTARDLLKAYLITQSSIGRQGLAHSTATKAGLKVPRTEEMVRPEGAFATWLGSKAGQKYLDAAMKGDLDKKAIAEIQYQFSPFGKQNALGESMVYAAQTIPEMSKRLNQTIMGTPEGYRDYAEGLKGIAGSKSGFIGSMLGRGDLPTFDARQIALHTAGEPLPTASASSVLNRGKGAGGREAVDRLAARQEALGLKIDPALNPYYQHLAHHAVWDKIGGDKTTHQDLIDAMTNYKDGGKVKRRDINEFKALGAPAAMPQPRATKVSQFEKDYFDKLAKEQADREQAVKSGLTSWVTDVPGFVADLAVDLPYYLGQRVMGRRGENIKPLGYGERVRSGLAQTLGLQNAPSDQPSMGRPPANEELTDLISLASPLAWSVAGDPIAVGRAGTKAVKSLGKAAGKEAGRRIDEAMMTGEGLLGSALSPISPMYVIKPKGGNWYEGAPKKAVEALKRGVRPQDVRDLDFLKVKLAHDLKMGNVDEAERLQKRIAEREEAMRTPLNDWIEKQLARYYRNELATPEDPVRALAEKGILHFDPEPYRHVYGGQLSKRREAAGYPLAGMAENPLGKAWEAQADRAISSQSAQEAKAIAKSLGSRPPDWMEKLDPNAQIYGASLTYDKLGFNHLIDELGNAISPHGDLPPELRIKPESLSKLSVPQAVERVAKINAWREKQAAEALKAAREGIPVHKEYPEGYQWMAVPDTEADERALRYAMDIGCEGGWCTKGEDLAREYGGGGNRLYALHDPKGKVVAQIRTSPNETLPRWDDVRPYLSAAEEEAKKLPNGYTDEDISNIATEMAKKAMPPSIGEIKGRLNRAPTAELLPYIQDFVRSGKWSRVDDLENAGLFRADPNELGMIMPENPTLRNLPGRRTDDLLKAQQAGLFGDKQYVTRQEYEDILRQQIESESGTLPPINDMKKGGVVMPSDISQDAMQMQVWNKQVQRKGMGGWMKGAGRTAEEAKRLFDIAKGTRAKAAQVEAGLYHPIGGGIKLSKPVELMQFETMKDPTVKGVQRKIITPEDLQGGIGIPLVGDRAAGGTLLTSVEGIPFRSPLTLEAGPDYMLTHTIPGSPESSIWRSGKGVISGLQKQVEFARDMGRPIYGVNVVGAPTNVNYNTMVTEAILNQYDPTALTKKAKKEFLKDIRNYAPDPDKPHLKPGSVLTEADLNDVEALRAKMLAEGAGPLRKVFVERMGQAPFQEAGFPDVPASRLATTEPLLVDAPTGSAGFTVGTIDPAARALEQTPRGHKTYPVALAGEYFGSLGQPIDYRNIFQEFVDKRRVFGKPEKSDWRSFSLSPQFQTFDQEWLDRVMKSAGADKPREWKKGGPVYKAEGGMTSDDLIVEERPL